MSVAITGGGGGGDNGDDSPQLLVQNNFPEKWVCDDSEGAVRVEVRTSTYWIEIPTSKVELFIDKGEAASIQRAAKVVFPTEWGEDSGSVTHNSPRKLVKGYDPLGGDEQQWQFARVSHYDKATNDWVYTHWGWIGGVGDHNEPAKSKMWVYDVSELLSNVPITETYNNPTVEKVAIDIAEWSRDDANIPIGEVVISPPGTEEGFEELADNLENLPTQAVGLFFNDRPLDPTEEPGENETPYKSMSVAKQLQDVGPKELQENFRAITLAELDENASSSKTFKRNRDTVIDIINWFEEWTQSKIHFEPAPSGESVILFIDIVPSRRTYSQNAVVEQIRDNPESVAARSLREESPVSANSYSFFQPIRVRNNNALYEMKPANTLTLRGETKKSLLAEAGRAVEGVIASLDTNTNAPSKKFPVVVVSAPPLVDAAGGATLERTVESNATTIEEGKQQAISEMVSVLEEPSEGEITMDGVPRMLPYDRVDAFETCGDFIEQQPQAVSYEVEGIKHTKEASGTFKTEIRVSIYANEEDIVVEDDRMEDLDE